MGTGFAKKKKQAKVMQNQLSKMQNEMQHIEVTGTAGNGLVTITLTGEHDMKALHIKPECVDKDDVDGLTDLIKLAYQNALQQLKNKSMQQMGGMGSGLSALLGK